MRGLLIAGALATALAAAPAAAQPEKIRIGFVNNFSGPFAVIGKDQRNAFELALQHLGGKIGGLDYEIIWGDDQVKPDVGVQLVDKMIQQNKVHFIMGVVFSNVLMAIVDRVLENNVIMISLNAGPSPMAGKKCHPNFFTTSWSNDQNAEAIGKLVQADGVKNVALMAPNYQAGKDNIQGFKRFYKGDIKAEILTKIAQDDFQPELSQVRSIKPEALFVFMPAGWGINFLKQWKASGLVSQFKLYSVWTVSEMTLGAIGEDAVGTILTEHWSADLPYPANRRFVDDFRAKYGYAPSHFAAQAYDGPAYLDQAVKDVKGNLKDLDGIRKSLRTPRYESVRGPYKLNVNHVPLQKFYKKEVVKDGNEIKIVSRGVVSDGEKDAYYKDCKMAL